PHNPCGQCGRRVEPGRLVDGSAVSRGQAGAATALLRTAGVLPQGIFAKALVSSNFDASCAPSALGVLCVPPYNYGERVGQNEGSTVMDNQTIADRLTAYANHLEAEDDNIFRVRAYRRAAETIRGLDQPAADVIAVAGRAGLEALPGIGT